MADTAITVALISVGSAALTGFLTYQGTKRKVRQDLEASYDLDLRTWRVEEYRKLWKLLEPLAKYARPGRVTYRSLRALSGKLRAWYFEDGGMFLSSSSRDAYFALQDEIKSVIASAPMGTSDTEISEPQFEQIRSAGSTVRTALAADVITRARSELQEA